MQRQKKLSVWLKVYISLLQGLCFISISGCTAGGLKLISQLEARQLKSEAITKREMCFEEFVNKDKFEECYNKEVFYLIADECITIRATEPITQEDCEDFLYRVVMKPDNLFKDNEGYEGFPEEFRSDNLHPVVRDGGCRESETCRDRCRSIFSTQDEKEACYQYSVSAITKLGSVFSTLESPSLPDLRGLSDLRSLSILFGIGGDSVIEKLTTGEGSWSSNEKKIILTWLAENVEVSKIFSRADHDFAFLENVIGGSNHTETVANINLSLGSGSSGDNFIDKLIEEENQIGLKWIHDFINNECNSSDSLITNEERKCVFEEYYCEFDLNNNNELDFFDYDFFTTLLDNILEYQRKATGSPSWWEDDTRSADLSSDQWQNGVCDNLKP